MPSPRLTLVVGLLVTVASVGVGAAAATGGSGSVATATQVVTNEPTPPMGANVSMFMQANAAQTEASVENGMWTAAFARGNNTADRQALVERRIGSMNATLADLKAQRRALQASYRNGTINRVTYQARISSIVGQLAALSESIDAADERGRAVGINATRLETLRTQAREIGGGEVSRIARNLTDGAGPPGRPGIFDGDRRGPPDDRGPGAAANRSNRTSTRGADRGQSDRRPAGSSTPTSTPGS